MEPFYIGRGRGARFALATHPVEKPVAGVLYVHPFAEELNKARRMAALMARALASQGILVLQIDMAGCGDSYGEFHDANWNAWQQDLSSGWEWLENNCDGSLGIWTLRSGSLLAGEWISRNQIQPPVLMWQPVTNGQQQLVQFLRLKAANEMLSSDGSKGIVSDLRNRLESGEIVEVAGYNLSSELADKLASAKLRFPMGYESAIGIVEIDGSGRSEISPGISAMVERLKGQSITVHTSIVQGASFWRTQEVEVVPELVTASTAVLKRILL